MVRVNVKKKKPTLRERAEAQQTPEGKKAQQERAEKIRQKRERAREGEGEKVVFQGSSFMPASENPELFKKQQAERERVDKEMADKSGETARKFIDIEKGKLMAKKTAERELLIEERTAARELSEGRVFDRDQTDGLTGEQSEFIDRGLVNQDISQFKGQPTFQDQPAGVQALQGGLIDIATTGGIGTLASGAFKVGGALSKLAIKKELREKALDLSNQAVLKKAGITNTQHIKSLEKLSQVSGKSISQLDKEMTNIIAKKGLDKMLGGNWKKWAIGGVGGVGLTALQADAYLANWYALDNVVGGTLINSNGIVNDFKFNPAEDPSAAIELLQEELDTTISIARDKVSSSTLYNPFSIIHKKLFMAGLEKDISQIERNIKKLELLREGRPVTDVFEEEATEGRAQQQAEAQRQAEAQAQSL